MPVKRHEGSIMILGVAFDLEGTVIDLEWAHWQGHLDAARKAGLILTKDQAIDSVPCFVGGPDEKVADSISVLCDRKVEAAVILEWSKSYFRDILNSVNAIIPRTGFSQVLATLIDKGISISIGSLTERSLAYRLIQRSGLHSYFPDDHIVTREDVDHLKPAPDVYLRTSRCMRINPDEQLVFEDSVNGVIAARRAGSQVIAVPTVTSNDFVQKLVKAGALHVANAWNEENLAVF